MASMIEKTMEMTRDEFYQDFTLDEVLTEACVSYGQMGQLFTELLSYYGGRFDDEAMGLLEHMMREYINDMM